jgi:hypothetical protein
MLKITLPEQADFYTELVKHPKVLKVVALSGGYSRLEGNDRLRKNHGLVAGFSRALVEGLVPRRCKKLPRGMELGNLPTWANCYRARQAEKEEQRPLRDSPSAQLRQIRLSSTFAQSSPNLGAGRPAAKNKRHHK